MLEHFGRAPEREHRIVLQGLAGHCRFGGSLSIDSCVIALLTEFDESGFAFPGRTAGPLVSSSTWDIA